MGHYHTIISNRDITIEEVEKIINDIEISKTNGWMLGNLPPKYKKRQLWGWSLYTDVKNPQDNTVTISGSYSSSGKYAPLMISHFMDCLMGNGHTISVESSY